VSVPIQAIYTDHRSHIRPVRDALRFVLTLMRHL